MVNIYSIKEIIEASNAILITSNKKKTNSIARDSVHIKKVLEPLKPSSIIQNKIMSEKSLILKKEIKIVANVPGEIENIIIEAEKSINEENSKKLLKQKIITKMSIKNEIKTEEIIDKLYNLFNKKIKKNTLKLILELRNEITSLDSKILSLNENQKKTKNANKFLKEDIFKLSNIEKNLRSELKKKDLHIESSNIKLNENQIQITELKNDNINLNKKITALKDKNEELEVNIEDLNSDIKEFNIKLYNYQNKISKLENYNTDLKTKINAYQNENKVLENNNEELISKINIYQNQIVDLEDVNKKLNTNLNESHNKQNYLELTNNELNLKLGDLNDMSEFKHQAQELKQKNTDLEHTLDKLKIKDDKSEHNLSIIKTLEDKINFYQEENIRISNDLIESRKKYELTKNQIQGFENQRSSLLEKIHSVNETLGNSRVVTNVFENNQKIDSMKNKEPNNTKKENNTDLNKAILNIFRK
jgi:chromosome segregation ATPase